MSHKKDARLIPVNLQKLKGVYFFTTLPIYVDSDCKIISTCMN